MSGAQGVRPKRGALQVGSDWVLDPFLHGVKNPSSDPALFRNLVENGMKPTSTPVNPHKAPPT